ncbi:MAG: discoidin domain-containing protein, partial [Varibaculum timonense]
DESKLNVWDFDPTEFSNGFSEDLKVMESQGAKLSVWMSPFGGYGTSAQRRAQLGNSKLQDQNKRPWEKSNKVMRLSDPIYFKYFRDKVFYMMDNGVQGFKFDGIAQGDLYITGAKNELIGDYEKLFELMQDMRGKNKDVWINATVGTWGSPYWFWYADSIYRDGNDAGQTGQGNSQEKYVNYRDQQVYQNMIVENPLVPINSVMNHGVIFSDRTDGQVPNQPHDFSNKSVRTAFSNDLKNFFSMGIGLQELYLRNTLFNAKNIGADNAKFAWDEIAKNAKWARQNVDLLTDTHWIGGSPGKGEVYGTAAWHNPGTSADDARAMISVRNPSNQPKYIAINAVSDLQIPGGQATRFKFTERDDKTNSWVIDNKPYYIQLKPFEVLLFEGRPTNEEPTQSEKPKVDPCYQQISQSDWEITVDSEQATGNEKDLGRYAIDNNPNTIWHTAWDPAIAQYPHSATVDMGRLNQVCRLTYLPRQSGGNNGDIKTYDLAVSKDGNNWQTVVTDGTFANDKEEKAIEIPKDKQEFRYFKLTAKSAQNGQAFAGAAELRAWGTAGKSEWLDQENWKCSASDYEATGENNGNSGWPKHACDNNLDTQWHSAYSGGVKPMPHWLQIDLGKIADVSALKYTPRQDAYPANGIVKEYRVEYSLDSNKWNQAAQGTLTDGKPATINFDATHRAKYIRFTAISAQNGQAFAGAAELDVKGSYVTATPEAPTFTDKDGTDNDTYTIPKIEGVRYLINGNEVAPGVHKVTNGTTTVQITATAAPGWELAPGDWSWEGKFTNTSTEPSQPKPATVTNSVYTSADTTLQSWQNEKVTSMAAKPYIGALRPGTNYGVFGEKFVSSDVSDGTDAKMGLL